MPRVRAGPLRAGHARDVRAAIIIPALDEEAALPAVLAEIPAQLEALIVVVDNGSRDRTAAVAEHLGATVLFEPRRGYGGACLRALRYLQSLPLEPPIVIILDADHADDPAHLLDFVERIERDEADLVLSTRTQGGAEPGSMTGVQIWGNRLQTQAINARFGAQLTDMGPMRAIRFDRLVGLHMGDRTWGWNVEMACKALRQELRVVEVSVPYRNRVGESKISGSVRGVIRAGGKILWAIWKYAR